MRGGKIIFDVTTADGAWLRVDRTLDEIRSRFVEADTEEQFQAVGHLCRDALISLAHAVYDPLVILLSMESRPARRTRSACWRRTSPSS